MMVTMMMMIAMLMMMSNLNQAFSSLWKERQGKQGWGKEVVDGREGEGETRTW